MPRSPKKVKTEEPKPYSRDDSTSSSPLSSTTSQSPKKAKGWTKDDKIKLLLEVLAQVKPDFHLIKDKFEGRTKTMVYDQWRQQVFPALKKEGSVDGPGMRKR